MPVIYQVNDPSSPDNPKSPLHKYHSDIDSLISVDLIGLVGDEDRITKIIVSEEAEVSDLQNWLGSELVQK